MAVASTVPIDWAIVEADLEADGCAIVPQLLAPDTCASISSLYAQDARFRSRVVMARHGFGRGEYKYFAYPLPAVIAELRKAMFPALSAIANRWNAALGVERRFPARHADFLEQCHRAGQSKPTPLLLRYVEGDFNCLHQDVYGEHVFPLQVAVLLAEPGIEFSGGEFVLAEQRPRAQSRVNVVPLSRGGAVIFPVRHRPIRGTRGYYRASIRHGVSRLRSGERYTLGIIFHDAK
jgi:hypothetical protein